METKTEFNIGETVYYAMPKPNNSGLYVNWGKINKIVIEADEVCGSLTHTYYDIEEDSHIESIYVRKDLDGLTKFIEEIISKVDELVKRRVKYDDEAEEIKPHGY